MPLKLGQRVTVLPGVSNCVDEGSKQLTRAAGGTGFSRERFVGMKGEIVQIGNDILTVKERVGQGVLVEQKWVPATIPPGCEDMVLVDSQVVNGIREGLCTMREWFAESELEVG